MTRGGLLQVSFACPGLLSTTIDTHTARICVWGAPRSSPSGDRCEGVHYGQTVRGCEVLVMVRERSHPSIAGHSLHARLSFSLRFEALAYTAQGNLDSQVIIVSAGGEKRGAGCEKRGRRGIFRESPNNAAPRRVLRRLFPGLLKLLLKCRHPRLHHSRLRLPHGQRVQCFLRTRRERPFTRLCLPQPPAPLLCLRQLPPELLLQRLLARTQHYRLLPRARELVLRGGQLLLGQLLVRHPLLHHAQLLRLHHPLTLQSLHLRARRASLLQQRAYLRHLLLFGGRLDGRVGVGVYVAYSHGVHDLERLRRTPGPRNWQRANASQRAAAAVGGRAGPATGAREHATGLQCVQHEAGACPEGGGGPSGGRPRWGRLRGWSATPGRRTQRRRRRCQRRRRRQLAAEKGPKYGDHHADDSAGRDEPEPDGNTHDGSDRGRQGGRREDGNGRRH
mmetsp:Transcript_8922/g.21936  ORF Transcript_8922/g.21936 Transcript_8922/m.21936 type:complete len:448 (-) Transcript_8922:338-1681(-)